MAEVATPSVAGDIYVALATVLSLRQHCRSATTWSLRQICRRLRQLCRLRQRCRCAKRTLQVRHLVAIEPTWSRLNGPCDRGDYKSHMSLGRVLLECGGMACHPSRSQKTSEENFTGGFIYIVMNSFILLWFFLCSCNIVLLVCIIFPFRKLLLYSMGLQPMFFSD